MSANADTALDRGDDLHAPGDLPERYQAIVEDGGDRLTIHDRAADQTWITATADSTADLGEMR